MPDLLDELILSGELQEMIVVSVDGWTSFGGSWYRNSPVLPQLAGCFAFVDAKSVQLFAMRP